MSEKQIQNDILREFGTRRDCRLWRQNTGVARMGAERVVRFGLTGQADLTGILFPSGKRLEIEVKAETGRQSLAQRRYQVMIERFGGIYVLARSVADVWAAVGPYLNGQGRGA